MRWLLFGLPALLALTVLAYLVAARGPWSFRAEYREAVEERLARLPDPGPPLTGAELDRLPAPVARYLRRSGVLGRPRPVHFRLEWKGRIRGAPDEPWMEFTAEQHSFPAEPARFFHLSARRGGLPVDVLHAYRGGEATMRVRLLSLLPLVDARGPEMNQAETVTLLNDLALFAPGGLLDPALSWEAVDDRTVRVRYTVERATVEATLRFDDDGDLVDFVSDDRMAAASDGTSFTPMRWSTPVEEYRDFDGHRASAGGVALWHPRSGEPWAYIEARVTALEVTPGP